MRNLKVSTARTINIFMTASSDHVTGLTGLGTALTITASKAGAAFASITPTVAELANGWYTLALTTTHTNTLGDLALHVTGTGCDPSDFLCQVTTQDPLDIQNGLATSSALSTAQTAITDVQARIPAALGANGNIKADIRDILGTASATPTVAGIIRVEDAVTQARLTSTRAGYIDNLSAGAVALASTLPAALVGGKMDSHVNDIAANAITAASIATDATASIASTVMASVIETGYTLTNTLRLIAAATAGRLSGILASAPIFRSLDNSKNRISGTTTTDGRTVVTYDIT